MCPPCAHIPEKSPEEMLSQLRPTDTKKPEDLTEGQARERQGQGCRARTGPWAQEDAWLPCSCSGAAENVHMGSDNITCPSEA